MGPYYPPGVGIQRYRNLMFGRAVGFVVVLWYWLFILVFVENDKLTAASIYNPICFVPEMVDKEAEIKQCISSFWDTVKSSIKHHTYTMDLALRPDLQNTMIVELNCPVCTHFIFCSNM